MADFSEVRAYSNRLRLSGSQHIEQVRRAASSTVDKVAEEARQNAPRDRPWLGTTDGIRTDTSGRGGTIRASVYSPRDPFGRNVGLHVEYGTSDTTPQPFMTPAFEKGRKSFVAEVGRIVSRL